MKKTFLIAAFFIAGICAALPGRSYAQDEAPKEAYIAANIPDSLKDGANSVVRYAYDEVIISGPGRALVKHHRIITILNEKGDKDAIVAMGYNKKYDVYNDITIRTFTADGTQLRKYHKSDMYDGAAIDDETIVTDERFLGLKIDIASYPTTIDAQYEQNESSFIEPEAWHIQNNEQSVQYAMYKVLVKPDMGFRYNNKNITISPVKKANGDLAEYTWEVKNLRAFKMEEGAQGWNVFPSVLFALNDFNCYGYQGNMSSWKNYGAWIYGLNRDVCTLSPERVAEIKKMTDTIKGGDMAKAKFLYEYLQKSVRYVSVQLGIGGYKPFAASFVDQKKYGDCKALANYMYALLNAVNIKSYWAVIRRGDNEYAADTDFPYNSFNHEILCIPGKSDTTWLECTSNTLPFGILDASTRNRNALMITENGGKLVNTPKTTPEENQFNSEVHLALNADGGAKASVKVFSTGGYRDMYIDMEAMKQDDEKQVLLQTLNIKQPSVFEIHPGDDRNGTKEIDLNLEYDRFYDIAAGDKQFYHPNVIDIWNYTIPIEEKRKAIFYFDHPMQKSCTLTIDLPAGFEVETLPANQQLKFTYGSYEVTYKYDAAKNQVISTAKFILKNQAIPAAKYTEMQQYLDNIKKAENKKLVIRHKA